MISRWTPSGPLRGELGPPADKSISHRAALLGAMSAEPVRVANYLDSADTNATLTALTSLGVAIERRPDELIVRGVGLRNPVEPTLGLDVANSGTLMRLLPGWVAQLPGTAWRFDGDASIRRRPVDRIARPLEAMGARVEARDNRYPPFTVHGARLRAIDPGQHDDVLATVSHLPHVLANVLVAGAAATLAADGEPLPATGPSFRDLTRVAGANTAMWRDIYLANADALVARIDDVRDRLEQVRELLAARDGEAVAAWNDGAAGDRRRLLEAGLAGGPVHELRVSVPNQPGVIAQLALALGRAGVNITDMALYPAEDMRSGRVALWIAGDDPAQRAEELVVGLGYPVTRP